MAESLETILGSRGACADRILATYCEATEDDIRNGAEWYSVAFGIAASLTSDPIVGAGIIAALSPQCSWRENVKRARQAIAAGTAHGLTFGTQTRKADAIAAGIAPCDALRGRKELAFAGCIIALGETSTVCLDRHAVDIAIGRVTDDKSRKILDRKGGYDYVSDAYRIAAGYTRWSPAQLQAITWVVWRKAKGLDWAD